MGYSRWGRLVRCILEFFSESVHLLLFAYCIHILASTYCSYNMQFWCFCCCLEWAGLTLGHASVSERAAAGSKSEIWTRTWQTSGPGLTQRRLHTGGRTSSSSSSSSLLHTVLESRDAFKDSLTFQDQELPAVRNWSKDSEQVMWLCLFLLLLLSSQRPWTHHQGDWICTI